MQNRAASNAAARCGDETTTSHGRSDSSSSPTRWSSATRSISGQRVARGVRDLGHRARRAGRLVRLVGHAPHAVAAVGVIADDAENATTAPAAGRRDAHASAASVGSGSVVKPIQSRPPGSGEAYSTVATVYGSRFDPRSWPSARRRGARSRSVVAVVRLATMGPAGDDAPRWARPTSATRATARPRPTTTTTTRWGPTTTGPVGAPPDRMDRLWVHPAELSPVAAAVPPPIPVECASRAARRAARSARSPRSCVLGCRRRVRPAERERPPRRRRAEQRVAEGDAALSQLGPSRRTRARARHREGRARRPPGDRRLRAAQRRRPDERGGHRRREDRPGHDDHRRDLRPQPSLGRDDATGLVLLHSERPLRAVPVSEETSHAGRQRLDLRRAVAEGRQPVDQQRHRLVGGCRRRRTQPGPMTGGLLETDALGTAAGPRAARSSTAPARSTASCSGRRVSTAGAYAVPIDARGRDRRRAPRKRLRRARRDAVRGDGLARPGPQITAVPPNGPAARAGLQPNDVIVVDRRERRAHRRQPRRPRCTRTTRERRGARRRPQRPADERRRHARQHHAGRRHP